MPGAKLNLSEDGTAVITATGLPADEAAAAWERLEDLTRTARRDGHPGTLDQIRADLTLGLFDGSLHGLTRTEILHALLERFAGHADPDTDPGSAADTRSDTLARADTGGLGTTGHQPDSGNTGDHSGAGSGSDFHHHAMPTPTRPAEQPAPAEQASPAEQGRPAPGDEHRVGTEIRIPLSTLLELDQRPGELPGWGPVPADTARRTVTRQRRAQWRWVVLDDNGHLIAEGITRRRPPHLPRRGTPGGIVEIQIPATLLHDLATTAADHDPWTAVITDIAAQFQTHDHHTAIADLDAHPHDRFPRARLRRHTQIRDRTCVHPGCRTPARHADQDHTHDHHHGGPTTHDDLAPLCRHDHMLKTDGDWELEQPEPGRFLWHSPLGRTYPVEPEPILPPPPTPVTRDHEPWFDEPARETDQDVDLSPRDRGPPASPTPTPTPTPPFVADDGRGDVPPF